MNLSGLQVQFSDLYKSLKQADLVRVARRSRMDLEDVRQEARLLCWSIATGNSTYNPSKGSPVQFIMGCLWGLAEHEHFHAHQEATETTELLSHSIVDEAANPLDLMEQEQERKAGRFIPDSLQASSQMSLEEVLWFSGGLSYAEISGFTGIGKTTVFKRITKKFQSIKDLK